MSRAFVKESDGAEADLELPELRVSPHRNLVTPQGLAQIDAELQRLDEALSAARAAEDKPALARHARDLRYWTQRCSTAEVVPAQTDFSVVRFGSRVTLEGEDGSTAVYQIVGEDEAAPAAGRISYVSPLAEELLGRAVGEAVRISGRGEAEIVAIG